VGPLGNSRAVGMELYFAGKIIEEELGNCRRGKKKKIPPIFDFREIQEAWVPTWWKQM